MPDLKLYLGNGTAIYRASLLGPDQSQMPGSKIPPPSFSPTNLARSYPFPYHHFPQTFVTQLSLFAQLCEKHAIANDTCPKKTACTGPIQGHEIAEGLGNVGGDFFRSHFVVFDYEAPAIYFAPFN